MFSAASKLMGAGARGLSVFKVNTRTGTGATASITGVPFAPDLYIGKGRSGATSWGWYDTTRGATFELDSTSSAAQTTQVQGITAFNSGGVSIGTLAKLNTNAATYVDYLLKKNAGFFDVQQFTAGSSTNRRITHNLGVVPGMVILKSSSNSVDWYVYHTSLGVDNSLFLDATNAVSNATARWGTSPTTTDFGLNESTLCTSGQTQILYLFAHDTSASSVIYCGTFTSSAGKSATVTGLPFQPKFLLFKTTSTTGDWALLDTARGWSGSSPSVSVNTAAAESAGAYTSSPTSDGFTFTSSLGVSTTYIYMAIKA